MAWGRVSLVDLYLGLVIFGAWIGIRERATVTKVAWWTSLLLLGNLAAGVYLTIAAFRAREVRQLLLGARVDE